MSHESIIHYYNRLNGNSISLDKLKEFRTRVEKHIDSHGTGPHMTDLKGILSRVSKTIKNLIAQQDEPGQDVIVERIDLVPIEVKEVKKVIPVKVEVKKEVAKPTPIPSPVKSKKQVKVRKPNPVKKKSKKVVVDKTLKPPATGNRQPATTSLSGVTYSYYAHNLGEFEKELYRMNSDANAMFWGSPGSGKTVKLLKLAQHFANQNKNVLYIANEEYGKSTFDEKLKQFNIGGPTLKITGELNPADIEAAEIIFFDSVNTLGLTPAKVKEMDKKYPNRTFILIVQTTKDGDFRGGQDWEHLVDIAGEIKNRVLVLRKNRFDPDTAAKTQKRIEAEAIAELKQKQRIKEAVKVKTQDVASQPKTTPS